jgi:hypothetical protein
MTARIHSAVADKTHRPKHPGVGIRPLMTFVGCGHKGTNQGAQMRGYMPWRCARCVADGRRD